MPDESKPITQEQLNKVFVNPRVQSAVLETLTSTRPHGWSRRSNAPYYKERYGLEAKEVIDRMMVDRLDSCYDYKYFSEKLGMARETVYLRVNQSLRYLIDKLDDVDRVYGRFMEMIRVERVRGVGVMIRFIPEFRDADVSSFVPTQVIPREKVPQWKEDMLEYLEHGEIGKPFFVDKLALTSDEINEIKLSLKGLKNVISNITAHSVKLVKTNYVEPTNTK